ILNKDLISWLAKIRSIEAFSTFKILPLIGKIAWVKRDLPCFAEPPAELPSTINNSEILGSLLVLSANLPGKFAISKPDFLRVTSRARLAAVLARSASCPFSTILRPTDGFSIKKRLKVSENDLSTAVLASELPNLVLV